MHIRGGREGGRCREEGGGGGGEGGKERWTCGNKMVMLRKEGAGV